ncbi:MAG TPA: hypothetical protein VFV67_04795 [Actinophytocola sp.]|uniref:hypothetical protein n=1 Tax=Actinophytocola sp. TaxID=1872138 RepID=UPI002DB6F155|nr:hypothetical protein [Actinophytocola sp.]HEU5469948.1 hypothetical protein [Actinophytocola sp.]
MTTRPDVLEIGRGLPSWSLRVLVAATGAGVVGVLAATGLHGPVLWLIGLAAAATVGMPSSPAPMLVLLLTAMSVVATGTGVLGPMLVLVPLLHLMHVSCALAGLVPPGARVHLAALRVPALRFVGVQAAVFALAGLMALVPGGTTLPVLEFAALLGVAGIALLVAWLVHRPQ